MELIDNQTKKILGLDIGTNSIGWAIVELPNSIHDYGKYGKIIGMGSRIIPADADTLKEFERGAKAKTKAAQRRHKRSTRRLKQRYKIRRERLSKVFKILGWVPNSFPFDNPKQIKQIIKEKGEFYFKMKDFVPFSEQTYREFYSLFNYSNEEINQVINKINGNQCANVKLLPEDWIVYFLRKKALKQKITISELVRIIFLFNQRRGFKSSRKDLKESYVSYEDFIQLHKNFRNSKDLCLEEEFPDGIITKFVSITKVKSVTPYSEQENKNGKKKFIIEVEDDRVLPWEEERKEKPNWEGKEYQFIVEQKIDKKGTIKQDKKPKIANQDQWELVMLSLDSQINDLKKHVGEFFFDKLLEYYQKGQIFKIRQNVIKREKYIDELKAIWNFQLEIRKSEGTEEELLNTSKLTEIIQTLYKHNETKQKQLSNKNLLEILIEDIIYYQRNLKSQKNFISECRYEKRIGIKKDENGNWIETGIYGLKCSPISSPSYQEFRIWQDIHNLKIIPKKNSVSTNFNEIFTYQIKEKLFDLFDSQSEITAKNIFDLLNKEVQGANFNQDDYQINLFKNRDKLKGNETKTFFRKIFRKYYWSSEGERILSDKEKFKKLWQVLYTVNDVDIEKTQKGIRKSLERFFPEMPETLKKALSEANEFEKKYAAFSSMAIEKLLPLMRCGKYWNWNDIQNIERRDLNKKIIIKVSETINSLIHQIQKKSISEEFEPLKRFIKEKNIQSISDFQGLPTWIACYIVYGRHSESENIEKYSLQQIKNLDPLKILKNSKLVGNPIVKKVVLETLCLTREICLKFGQPEEIHLELARELKKNNQEKKEIAEANKKNEEERKIIKKILTELLHSDFSHYDEEGNKINQSFTVKPNPNNPNDIDLFKIYKESGKFDYNNKIKKSEDNNKIKKSEAEIEWENLVKSFEKEGNKEQIHKYILWLSQKCVSPYTGKIIPLSKLFDASYYEKEHAIPRSKLKNDSFNNIIICETPINKAKGNELAANFIKKSNGECEYEGKKYKLLKYDDYKKLCEAIFKGQKLKNLLAEDVPVDFITRQINDTRYIGKKLSEFLKPFARNENGLVFTIGSITNELKQNWGLNQVWKQLFLPRFQRLEKLIENQNKKIIFYENNEVMFKIDEEKDLDLKRLDHRHHALDALIIAVTTREHIRYLNTLSAANSDEEIKKIKQSLVKQKFRDYITPWNTFVPDAKNHLEKIITTFKVNKQIFSKPINKYSKWVQNSNGKWEKVILKQKDNPKWLAVRRNIFHENPLGIIYIKNLKDVDVLEAIKIQIQKMQLENSPKRNTASYIYDQEIRKIIILIIKIALNKSSLTIDKTDELLSFIKNKILNIYKIKNGYYLHRFITGNSENSQITQKIKVAHFTPFKVKRVQLDKSFNDKKIKDKIPYANKSPFSKILLNHLQNYNNKPNEAFEGEGLEKLMELNQGKPIKTLRILDGVINENNQSNIYGNRYWETGNGAVAYSVIYEDIITQKREFETIATHEVLKLLHEGKPIITPQNNKKIIVLQAYDLVYVPTDEEWDNIKKNLYDKNFLFTNKLDVSRIYRFVKSINKTFYFLPVNIAYLIIEKIEFTSQNCSEYTTDFIKIKERCIKIKLDRLGNIVHYDL